MHDRNVLIGQGLARVQRRQLGVVPLSDLAQIHFGQHGACDTQLARFETFQIHHRHGSADDGGELHHAVAIEISAGDRRVCGTESHRFCTDLADATRGTDRLIIQAGAGVFFIGFCPLGIHRKRERGTCAGYVCRKSAASGQGGQCYSDGFQKYAFH